MAYKTNNTVTIADDRSGSFANVTIQNNGFLEVNSSDGFQGTVAGYTSGGFLPGVTIVIDKFPFATDTNATDVGDLTAGRYALSGQSSSTHGYSSGGGPGGSNIIEKFPFFTDTNSTDVGDITESRENSSGQSSATSGYTSGGGFGAPGVRTNVIDKFPFSTDTNATDVGDLTQARQTSAGQSSTTHGYASGGTIPTPNTPPFVNTIEKFPFATDTNATDIGDLTLLRAGMAGQSSTTNGYSSGGSLGPPGLTNTIDKFPFSSDSNATDVGDLTQVRQRPAGQQD
jgi:hypothetical protein